MGQCAETKSNAHTVFKYRLIKFKLYVNKKNRLRDGDKNVMGVVCCHKCIIRGLNKNFKQIFYLKWGKTVDQNPDVRPSFHYNSYKKIIAQKSLQYLAIPVRVISPLPHTYKINPPVGLSF